MGGHSHRCCSKQKVKKGLWSPEEDDKLLTHITTHGHGSWSSVPTLAGLQRCGKSCRLRWINYLRPDLKRGSFSEEEEQIIIDVHRILGNRWAQIAKHLPGRTDNEVKNYWNSCIKKKLMSQGLDPNTHNLMPSHQRAAFFKTSTAAVCSLQQQQQQSAPSSQLAINYNFTTHNSSSSSSLVDVVSNVPMEIISPHHVLTTPAPPPPPQPCWLLQPIVPSDQYRNPNFVWDSSSNYVQNSQVDHDHHHSTNSTPCYISSPFDHHHQQSVILQAMLSSSRSSSSLMKMNPSEFRLSSTSDHEHNCMGYTTLDTDLITEPMQQQQQEQEDKERSHICDEADIMDCSLDSSSLFDRHVDEFVDSTLLAAGAMCRDFSSIPMDDFSWNF